LAQAIDLRQWDGVSQSDTVLVGPLLTLAGAMAG
jgi:hypothetical protein